MKNKITRIWGVGLVVALLASLLVMAIPASAVDNAWDAVVTPGAPPYQVYVGSAVADIAVYNDGEQIWLVTGTDNYTYKSTDGGATWVPGNTTAFTDITPDLIAIAPDTSSVIAVADISLLKVYVTNNGGVTWTTLGTIADTTAGTSLATMTGLDVSSTRAGSNRVAVSGVDNGSDGNVYVFSVGTAAPTWGELKSKAGFNTNQNTDTGGTANSTSESVYTIAFSPNYPSDQVLVAVSGNVSGGTAADNITYEIYSFAHSKWNASAGFTTYPTSLLSNTGTDITGVTNTAITLDPEYLGSDDILRNAFIGFTLTGNTASSGIYQMKDTGKKAIDTAQSIYSLAYDGTNLIAGTTTNTVRYSSDPMASVPSFYPTSSLKSPAGSTNAVVAWAGTNAVAGTSGGNSAFSVSANNGKSWNSISMVTTAQTNSRDVAVTADGSKVYHVTDNGTYVSLWRSATGWQRILTFADTGSYMIRMAPDNPDVLYMAEKNSTTIYYTKDGGADKWYQRTCGVTLVDLAVESADVAYAIDAGGSVAKTTNAGFTWDPPKATSLGSGYTVTSVSTDVVLAGGTAGLVAYSTDGNKNWTKISKPIATGAGSVIVTADSAYATNNIIYAATTTADKTVAKFTIGTSSSWLPMMAADFGTTESVYGLKVVGGVLYALSHDTSDNHSALYSCLSPTIADYTAPFWDSVVTTSSTDSSDTQVILGNGSASNNALVGSIGSNKLWTVKTNGTQKLYSYIDIVAVAGPTLKAPANAYSDPVNTVTGKANEIAFSWSRLSNATQYDLWIAYDEAFTQMVTSIDTGTKAMPTVVIPVGPDRTTPTGAQVNFMPGTTYYWKVRATSPLTSPFSEVRKFTIQPGVALVPTIGSPVNGATISSTNPAFSWSPVAGATQYEFQLALSTNFAAAVFTSKLPDTGIRPAIKLDAGMTYFWRVRAIAPVTGDWSTISNFIVAEEVVAPTPTPPVVIEQVPAPIINIPAAPPAQQIVIPPAPTPPAPIAPAYIWAIIIIGAVLVIAVIVLIVRTRRTV